MCVESIMSSVSIKKSLCKLFTFMHKYLGFLKLSILRIHRPVLTLLRLVYGFSHKLSSVLLGPKLSLDDITGAAQPAVLDIQNQIPLTTLAVRAPESRNSPPFQHVGSPLAFPSVQVSMDHGHYSVQTASAVSNVRRPGEIRLVPIIASQIARYNRNITQKKDFHVFEVSPGLDNFTEPSTNVANWLQLTHPQGARFFFNPLQRVFTDQNILKDGLALEILAAATEANQMVAEIGKVCATMELAVEKLPSGAFGYYFVDHDARIIFWPETVRSRHLMNHVRGVVEKSHIRYALEAQYWKHCTLFPNMRALPAQAVDRLRDIIAHAYAGSITFQTLPSPFHLDELEKMLSVVDRVKDRVETINEHSVCIVARYMDMFVRDKFVNFCGQPGARLDTDQSLYYGNSEQPKSILYNILNVALFNSPTIHGESIRNVWVDNSVVKHMWNDFICQLSTEFNGVSVLTCSRLQSTVMLTVDISFLAVPGADDSSIQSKPTATIFIYLSTLCAMGSLLSGNGQSSASSMAIFMGLMFQSFLGIESLAFMLSLPYALLIWGMIFFSIGLSILIFYTTDIIALTVVTPIWAVIVLLTMWPVLATNSLHVPVVAVRAAKSCKDIIQRMAIIRRQ
ncbi:hypothetical protein DEU56DRAFT_904044 [Suillus clintonianus]|uniref:uncharacterized protein n=1 Tax=Suillus clintonianus TaxID=1904413 RepID=UPI001B85CB77|nr:uncharacterized protein DEU56DRAFT_904044 [Suillus clintonianus]KAG2124192.1 hypothetical protein DEU56DRAFT_904044 [Suillus clintonianus]